MVLQPNANWTAKNVADYKQPIYAIQILPNTTWFHDHEISGATASHEKRLLAITGISLSFDPLRGEASRGSITFELLSNADTNLAFETLYNDQVEVRAGYAGLDWADYVTVGNLWIQTVKSNSSNTGHIFTAQDTQKMTNKNIDLTATVLTGNPIDIWLKIMTSTGAGTNGAYDTLLAVEGLGIDDALIDVAGAERLRDDFYAGFSVSFAVFGATNANSWIKTEIFKPFGLGPIVSAAGIIGLRAILPPLYGYMLANNRAAELTDSHILPLPSWDANFRDIINRIIFNYDWNGSTYATTVTYNKTAYQTQNGIVSLTISSKGITTALAGASITEQIAGRYLRKYHNMPSKVQLSTLFSKRVIEAGDQVLVNTTQISDRSAFPHTKTDYVYEVEAVSPDFPGGKMGFTLRDISHEPIGRYGVIGPNDLPDYGSATDAQKLKYCWIEPSTGDNYLII